jgi:hypothetical protein
MCCRSHVLLLLLLLLLGTQHTTVAASEAGLTGGGGGGGGSGSNVTADPSADHVNMERLLRGYGDEMYKTMRDDVPRTAAYRAAIERLAPGKVVLDIGTGQFALLATIAARAGARYVYAIEGNRAAYERAVACVADAGLSDRIGVLFGYSANVSLQELPPPPVMPAVGSGVGGGGGGGGGGGEGSADWGVELVVHELLGEIAGMEGAAYAIADAHRRHLRPTAVAASSATAAGPRRPRVSIPYRARSYIVPSAFPPASYWASLPMPVIMSPGTTFLKVWDYPHAALLAAQWQQFEVLEFDRLQSLTAVQDSKLRFVVKDNRRIDDGDGDDGEELAGNAAGAESDARDAGQGRRALAFAGFVCYMDSELLGPAAADDHLATPPEIDTLRDRTHWAQQLLLFTPTTVFEGDVIELSVRVDNGAGRPFTRYSFEAHLRPWLPPTMDGDGDGDGGGGAAEALPPPGGALTGRLGAPRALGKVSLDQHF